LDEGQHVRDELLALLVRPVGVAPGTGCRSDDVLAAVLV
jgi:hypothetical protein